MSRRSYDQREAVAVVSISSPLISPPATTNAPSAHSKSPIAPLSRICAFCGCSSGPRSMRSGACTSSASDRMLHAASGAASSAADDQRARSRKVRVMEGILSMRARTESRPISSEGHLDGADEGAELRRDVLLPLPEAAVAALEGGFRLEPLVLRPRVEVAAGEGDGERAGVDHPGPLRRQGVRHGDLAELRVARVLDHPAQVR